MVFDGSERLSFVIKGLDTHKCHATDYMLSG